MYSDGAKALKRIFVVGIAFLVAWSSASVLGAVGSNERETYLVSLNNDTSPEVLRTIGTKVLVDYGNGLYLIESTRSQASWMNRIGDVVRMKNNRMLDLYPSDITFDTSSGSPRTPPHLVDFDWDGEMYIVQFVGPYKSEWLEYIEEEEGSIGKLAPTFSAVVKMSPSLKEEVSELPYVQWVGAYKPFYKISRELLESEGTVRIAVTVFEESQRSSVSKKLVDMGVSVLMSYPSRKIIGYADAELLPWIVTMSDVLDVRKDFAVVPMDLMSAKIHGAFESWNPLRSGLPSSLSGQSPGPDGIEGTSDDYFEVVGIQDGGFDIGDPDKGHTDLFKGPNGDRVIRLTDRTGHSVPDGFYSGLSHGTQVVGTVLGNGFAWEHHYGEPTDDDGWEHTESVGIVPEGKLSFDGVQGFGGGLYVSPAYWDIQYYDDGAHINVNAYGSPPANYGSDSWEVDLRIDMNNDRLMVFAATNEGPDLNTLSSNAQAKNGLTSGASLNFRPIRSNAHNPNLVADFSSRGGPQQGLGRLKPDLVTVGTQAISLMGIGEWQHNAMTGIGNPQDDCIMEVDVYNHNNPDDLTGDGICDYRYYEFGTSVSTPNLGGLSMLVREYLREIGGISNPYQINSQLVKALMINGAVRMDETLFEYPYYDQGWGRVDLVQSLFPPAPRTNKYEEGVMTTTGLWNPTFETVVHTDEIPLKVTLVWVDSAGRDLFRDLNLKVTSPGGVIYKGNVYGSQGIYDGWSVPDPLMTDANPVWDRLGNDGWDDVNNVEQVEVQFPEPGTWKIEVIGFSIPSDTPFALVAGADFGPQDEYGVELTADHASVLDATESGDVVFPFSVTNFGTGIDSVFLDGTTPVGISLDFEKPVLFDVKSRETIATYVLISVASGVMCGLHDLVISATSSGDASATDQLDLSLNVRCARVPYPMQITNGTVDEMEPSVLTFNDGTTDHIFISYRKTTPIAPNGLFGGVNVWVAHTTLDGEGQPILPFTHMEVSNWNDDPTDLRWTYIPSGAKANRIMLTWTGDDPEATGPMDDTDSYGVLHFSDPPYTQWNRTIIERNAGSNKVNEARVNIPIWRDDGTPNGEFLWVFEHLDYVNIDANNPSSVETWVVISHDGGETFGVCGGGNDPDCKRISPYDNSYYFFPDACVDTRDVLWVFFYYRQPAGNDRDLMVRLYDGQWQGDSTPLDPRDDVSLLWNTDGTNLRYPTCLATGEGPAGNRMYVSMLNDLGRVNHTIWLGYLDGHYDSNNPPWGLNRTETFGLSPNLHGPNGPMGISIAHGHYERGPILNMEFTNDNVTWIMYLENSNKYVIPDLMAVDSTDAFASVIEYSQLTSDTCAKGHKMTDSLTVNMTHHNVYEVFHMSEGTWRDVNYNVHLLIYGRDWQHDADTMGPLIDPIIALPNPLNVSTRGTSLTLLAGVSDVLTGMSNISAAQWKEVPLSVTDPRQIDWSGASPMVIGTDSPTETGIAVHFPATWDGGETHRLCARGLDEYGNWGIGSCTDVVTIGKLPFWIEVHLPYDVPGWLPISVPFPGGDQPIDSVFNTIRDKYDQVRSYDPTSGDWLSYNPSKPVQTIDKVDNIKAYWVHFTSAPATLTISGNVSYVTDVKLQPGWNFVGYPSILNDSVTVGQLLDDPMLNIDRVEGYDGSNSPYFLKELDPGYYLKPGEGYWMHVAGDRKAIWSVVGF